ncbi:MAG TPA: hypothetical protein VLH60_05115 [Sedimentisphaerales bacterium]|nr:hypothetical protein [Sedimentisphaerales bacterium]
MKDDLTIFFNTDEFAELVDIESADDKTVWWDVPAIVDYGIQEDYGGAGSILERARVIIRAEGDGPPEHIRKGDLIVVSGVVWTVALPTRSTDGTLWEIEVKK